MPGLTQTLPMDPPPHIALDYAELRARGLRLLGELAGTQWTDFNAHDPGITILEQLCYAITELAYRINHPIADLLSSAEAAGLPTPEEILTGPAVTTDDLRKLAVDASGIRNAWAEPETQPAPAFYHHGATRSLRLEPDPREPEGARVSLRGLYRILLQPDERSTRPRQLRALNARLHAGRLVGQDLEGSWLGRHEVALRVSCEISAVEDPQALMVDVIEAIEDYLAPRAAFSSLVERLAEGDALAALLEGPRLDLAQVPSLPEPRNTLYASGLIHALMDVPNVRAVRSLALLEDSAGGDCWELPIPAGQVAALAARSELSLQRDGMAVSIDGARVQALRDARRAARAGVFTDRRALAAPQGRERGLADYSSVQRQLPSAYGVGAMGLPPSADGKRRAQARQLEAYLLIFDQLLANGFAQLAQAPRLLSPQAQQGPTYFTQAVDDLELTTRLVRDPEHHPQWLQQIAEQDESPARRRRFIAHLLSRYAEPFDEAGQSAEAGEEEAGERSHATLLQRYPELGRTRGCGHDLLTYGPGAPRCGLEQRIALKLGLDPDGSMFHMVEHILLRPVPQDRGQLAPEGELQVPLLDHVHEADPFSLQVSFVFEEPSVPDPRFEARVAHALVQETPAHVRPQLHFFGGDDWPRFVHSLHAFRTALRAYREADADGPVEAHLHLGLRANRDRLIDLLGFGRTYPLCDLPFPAQVVIAPGAAAQIPLEFSQADVDYMLCDRDTGAVVSVAGKPQRVQGTGGAVALPAPVVDRDVSYRIRAVKREQLHGAEPPRAWLHGDVRVKRGVDTSLRAELQLPPLDAQNDRPHHAGARLADYGNDVTVFLARSQEGVSYALVNAGDPSQVLSTQDVVGIGGAIALTYPAVNQDMELRVRGRRRLTDAAPAPGEAAQDALLDATLTLRVRADSRIGVSASPAVAEHGGRFVVTLNGAQVGVRYSLFRRPVRDSDFDFDPSGVNSDLVEVRLQGGRTLGLRRPPTRGPVAGLPGFELAAEPRRCQPADGSRLQFELKPLEADSLLLVCAVKEHAATPTPGAEGRTRTIASEIQLEQGLGLLVRPDPSPDLRLQVSLENGPAIGSVTFQGGQPGVYYALLAGSETELEEAYVHQRSEHDQALNKGIDQLRVEIDLTPTGETAPAADRGSRPPPAPAIDGRSVPLDQAVQLRARRAMTGVETRLAKAAVIHPAPPIYARPTRVAAGGEAQIVVEASVVGERYRLLGDGQPLGEVREGNGGELSFGTGPLQQDQTFVISMQRSQQASIEVERRVSIDVSVDRGPQP